MKTTGRDRKIRASFEFLRSKSKSRSVFSLEELSAASGWTEYNARTNISKRLKGFVTKNAAGNAYSADSSIADVKYDNFLSLFRQADLLTPKYNEYQYSKVLIIELYLPLTCEAELRRALNRLSYSDTLLEKLQTIDSVRLEKAFPRHEGEQLTTFHARLCGLIGDYFSGYSIGQVAGRFRVADLVSRAEAADLDAEGEDYLLDETTAVVKFIVPIQSSETLISADGSPETKQLALDLALDLGEDREIEQIEWLFRNVFLSSILNTVGQAEIWAVESGARFQLNRYISERRDQ
jgi:hypothetical protein